MTDTGGFRFRVFSIVLFHQNYSHQVLLTSLALELFLNSLYSSPWHLYKGDSQESISGAPCWSWRWGNPVLQPVRTCPSYISTAVSWVRGSFAEEGLTFALPLLGWHFQGTVHHRGKVRQWELGAHSCTALTARSSKCTHTLSPLGDSPRPRSREWSHSQWVGSSCRPTPSGQTVRDALPEVVLDWTRMIAKSILESFTKKSTLALVLLSTRGLLVIGLIPKRYEHLPFPFVKIYNFPFYWQLESSVHHMNTCFSKQ